MSAFKEKAAKAVAAALGKEASKEEILSLLEKPPQQEMGDAALPCFRLSPKLKKKPAQIASALEKSVQLPPEIEKAEASGPYLNFFFAKESLAKNTIQRILKEKTGYGKGEGKRGKKVMVEYSSPNTNKPLHLGHLRNGALGMSLSLLLEASGKEVVKANLVNDRGIHICKSMLAYSLFGKGETPEKAGEKGDHFVGRYYVLYNKKAGEKPELENQAYALLKKWEKGERKTVALWKKMNKWVLQGFRETYNEFGSRFDQWFFESEFYNKAKPLLEKGKEKGIFTENEEGALLARLEKFGLPDKTVLRSDGTSIYITNDLALTKHKFEKFHLDESLWVVGVEQSLYFRQLFKTLELLGFEWAKSCRHLSHGMVFLPEGKLKSREGKVVDADAIISEMKGLAEKEILAREKGIGERELEKRKKAIALAAIKFHLLKVAEQKDILFDPEESISFEGETGPYLQYTYARAKSILRKARKVSLDKVSFRQLESAEEKQLVTLLHSFPQIVQKSAASLSPHTLCHFLIQASEAFNSFYHAHPVLQAENVELKKERLALVKATAQVLANGLRLLDIEAIEKM